MCWESTESLAEKEHREKPEKVANKLVETTEKQKHEEEHVEPTLNTGNRLKSRSKNLAGIEKATDLHWEQKNPNNRK